VVYIIYGVADCPWCIRAQADLMEKDREHVFIEMSYSPAFREAIKKYYSWNTYPIIVARDEEISRGSFVGGYQELAIHLLTV